jgi:hypothetical protein
MCNYERLSFAFSIGTLVIFDMAAIMPRYKSLQGIVFVHVKGYNSYSNYVPAKDKTWDDEFIVEINWNEMPKISEEYLDLEAIYNEPNFRQRHRLSWGSYKKIVTLKNNETSLPVRHWFWNNAALSGQLRNIEIAKKGKWKVPWAENELDKQGKCRMWEVIGGHW